MMVPLGWVGMLVLFQHGAWVLLERSLESGMRQARRQEESLTRASDRLLVGPKLQHKDSGPDSCSAFNLSFLTVLVLQGLGSFWGLPTWMISRLNLLDLVATGSCHWAGGGGRAHSLPYSLVQGWGDRLSHTLPRGNLRGYKVNLLTISLFTR